MKNRKMTSELIFFMYFVLQLTTVLSKNGGKTRDVRKPLLQLVVESVIGALFSCSTIPKPRHKNGTINSCKSECNNRKKIFPRAFFSDDMMLNVQDLKLVDETGLPYNRTTGDAYYKFGFRRTYILVTQ